MPNYRRDIRTGGTYFFTLVTCDRHPFLCDDLARRLLREAIAACQRRTPFTIDAFVIMPDHLHTMWTLPAGDDNFPRRWAAIKRAFTLAWLAADGCEATISASQRRYRRRGVWQKQYWEHRIRDEVDRNNHLDYIHYNPVKHGHAACPHLWPWSSFHRLTQSNHYTPDWCCRCEGRPPLAPEPSALDELAIENTFGE